MGHGANVMEKHIQYNSRSPYLAASFEQQLPHNALAFFNDGEVVTAGCFCSYYAGSSNASTTADSGCLSPWFLALHVWFDCRTLLLALL
jgi:hypothetical protein